MINVKRQIIPSTKKFAKHYRLQELLDFLGNPERRIPTINVVGTNGKGSTTTALAVNLTKNYKKVGWFISPAFVYHNERIRVNDEMISDEKLLQYLSHYQELIQEYQLTFFEIWTLIMVLYFAEEEVELAVVEAGIGGAYDATAVMSNQLMVVVTSISLDHTEILGESIDQILEQKLGMAKPKRPIFMSADNYQYRGLIADWSKKHPGHEIIWAQETQDAIDYQKANKGLALTIFDYLHLPQPKFEQWPLGRFTLLQEKPYRIIIDGAHNENGWERLLKTLHQQQIKPALLFASSKHKNHQAILRKLNNTGLPVYITTFDHPKAWDLTTMNYESEILVDWKRFLEKPLEQDLLISGSLYFVAQVYEWWIRSH